MNANLVSARTMPPDTWKAPLILRHADDTDAIRFWRWWTDKETQRFNGSFERTTWEGHLAWFCENLANPYWYVGVRDDAPVGAVRFDPSDTSADVGTASIVVDPLCRGVGVGTELLMLATDAYRRGTSFRIEARIHRFNVPSQRAFEKAGYVKHSEDGPWLYYTR